MGKNAQIAGRDSEGAGGNLTGSIYGPRDRLHQSASVSSIYRRNISALNFTHKKFQNA